MDERARRQAGRGVEPASIGVGHRAVRAGAVVADLGHLQVIDVTGPDAVRWANGMWTQNLRDRRPGEVVRTGWTDDRGRLEGLAHVIVVDGATLRVILEGTTAAAFSDRFARYAMFDDVAFEDRSGDLGVVAVIGAGCDRILDGAGIPRVHRGRTSPWRGGDVAGVVRSCHPGADLVVPRSVADEAIAALVAAGAVRVDEDLVEVLRVEAGRVRWPVDMAAARLPHELGLRDEILAFDKGCYVGQETINRLDVRGRVRKRLALLALEAPVVAGAEVLVADAVAGVVTSPVSSPLFAGGARGGHRALAVLRCPWDEVGTEIRVRIGGGPVVGRVVAPCGAARSAGST